MKFNWFDIFISGVFVGLGLYALIERVAWWRANKNPRKEKE